MLAFPKVTFCPKVSAGIFRFSYERHFINFMRQLICQFEKLRTSNCELQTSTFTLELLNQRLFFGLFWHSLGAIFILRKGDLRLS